MTFPSATCCEHGHQRGKCIECEAAADIADLNAALEAAESEVRALRCEVARLRGDRTVLAELLEHAVAVLRTIDPEDASEGELLEGLIARAEKACADVLTPNDRVQAGEASPATTGWAAYRYSRLLKGK